MQHLQQRHEPDACQCRLLPQAIFLYRHAENEHAATAQRAGAAQLPEVVWWCVFVCVYVCVCVCVCVCACVRAHADARLVGTFALHSSHSHLRKLGEVLWLPQHHEYALRVEGECDRGDEGDECDECPALHIYSIQLAAPATADRLLR